MKNDFEDIDLYLNKLINELKTEFPKKLDVLSRDILAELYAGDFKNITGDLRSSMEVQVMDYSLKISMLDYGYFVSFGVSGGDHTGLKLTPEVESVFGVQSFTSKRYQNWGISPRNFYPNNIQQRILDLI